eukprot:4932954-Amphidinium_carterae.1
MAKTPGLKTLGLPSSKGRRSDALVLHLHVGIGFCGYAAVLSMPVDVSAKRALSNSEVDTRAFATPVPFARPVQQISKLGKSTLRWGQ